MLHVQGEAGEAGAELEARECQLVDRDRSEPRQRHRERVMVENRDAEERQSEQNEIDRNAEK